EVVSHSKKGALVLGICNGFQILTESGLLPGVLLRNASLKFICRNVHLRVESVNNPFTKGYTKKQTVKIPIAHGDGNYFINKKGIKEIKDNEQIAFRYCNAEGGINTESNPNGSLMNIAGILNQNKNVLGMMPHPERVSDKFTGGSDGEILFQGIIEGLSK
ncbi:MAG: phosphoribosylformylglycinamidine synthase I, partial [Pseudomonadota bacterium]|nr:phosphoribosylformylglycinamidine synthase I [Pseudomonadota bacterium]